MFLLKIILISLIVLFLIAFLLLIGISYQIFQHATSRKLAKPLETSPNEKNSRFYQAVKVFLAQPKQEVSIKANDGLELKAWYIPANKKTNKFVIIVHGYGANKAYLARFGILFHDLGFNVLMPDNRGAGDSQGNRADYGALVKLDLKNWVVWLINQFGKDIAITMFGGSMGAATVLQYAGLKELPKQVKNVIADASYTSAYNILKYQLKSLPLFKKLPFLITPVAELTSLISKLKTGVSFKDANPLQAVKNNHLPTLFIAGKADRSIPYHMTQTLYKQATSPKQILLIKGADHVKSYDTDPVLYKATVEKFLNNNN